MTWTRQYNMLMMQPSLDDARSHLRLTSTDLDPQIRRCLYSAFESCEKYIGKKIARSMFRYSGTFARSLSLPTPVIQTIGVKVDNVTLTAQQYTVAKGVLTIADGVTGSALVVEVECGMLDVPFDIQNAVLLRTTTAFDNPGDTVQVMQRASDNLLRPYRTWENGE